jgi:hypothetical protein
MPPIPRSARSAVRGGDRRPPQPGGMTGVQARLPGPNPLHRIIGRCDGRNRRSAAVPERNGMRLEAHLVENEFVKGEWADGLVYAILRREWESSRG